MTYKKSVNKGSSTRIPFTLEPPGLIEIQIDSFRWLMEEGLSELFSKFSLIPDFTGNQYELRLLNYEFRPPRYSEQQCREEGTTYAAPLYARTQLEIKQTKEAVEQTIFLGDFPMMTPNGTFIISGTERVVVSQLIRSPGVYFTLKVDLTSGRDLCSAKVVPLHGAWLDFETSAKDVISVKVEGRRRFPITTLLRATGYRSNDELLNLFDRIGIPQQQYIRATIDREDSLEGKADLDDRDTDSYQAFKYADGSPTTSANLINASTLLNEFLFNPRRYNLGKVGRYKLNRKLGRKLLFLKGILSKEEMESTPPEEINRFTNKHFQEQCLTKEDIVAIVWHQILINNALTAPDDIDHLGNRRVRTVGELIHNQLRIGMLRLERIVKERMSVASIENLTPSNLINIRPLVTSLREFFAGSQLSQFMDQINPLAELTHKRRLSALGPGGLSRERAGFEVRDVHYSHYGRICPIETPEGPNIGLIGALAIYARINEFGFIETPYRKVIHKVPNNQQALLNRILNEAVADDDGKIIAETGKQITSALARRLSALAPRTIKVVPFPSSESVYLTADDEEDYTIVSADARLDDEGHFIDKKIEVRHGPKLSKETPDKIDLMDVSPRQIISIPTSLIPFLEHDDANRALMGANMQRQAVPLIQPEPPLVGTGTERTVAQVSSQALFAPHDGVISRLNGEEIGLRNDGGEEQVYPLTKFLRTNQGTCITQHPLVNKGDKVQKGQILVEGSACSGGELALGQNVLCAFMSWGGYNFEDAIIISESLIKKDKFTSIHIERYEAEARGTKLGPEEITRDVANVGEESLRFLDENGVVLIGATVEPRDILVGKVTPKGETELTAEEKLLRALFGEKAHKVKDTSLRMPHGERGRVINVRTFSREQQDRLPAGVIKLVHVWVAQERHITEGDKLTGRHGNKGVISCILPEEDMPFLPDGTPIEIVLNPVSVPSRMNLGQILETHLGWALKILGSRISAPAFESNKINIEDILSRAWIAQQADRDTSEVHKPSELSPVPPERIEAWLARQGYEMDKVFSDEHPGEAKLTCLRLWLAEQGIDATGWEDSKLLQKAEELSQEKRIPLPFSGKTTLYDGRTGEPFDEPVTVGYTYMMKLIHLVEDKVHARSTGPYSLVTQQPLGGKAQFGGQRFGEMEAWALEAYGAAYTLQELLTIKSDDVVGRAKAYEHIIKGEELLPPRVPASYKVLEKELQSLGLAIERIEERDRLLEEESDSFEADEEEADSEIQE